MYTMWKERGGGSVSKAHLVTSQDVLSNILKYNQAFRPNIVLDIVLYPPFCIEPQDCSTDTGGGEALQKV